MSVAIAQTGCSVDSSSDGARPSTSIETLDELEGPGYELILDRPGTEPRFALLVPPPVGQRFRHVVQRRQEGLVVEAVIDTEVTASAADGSSATLVLELVEVDAEPDEAGRSLSRAVGARLDLARDDLWAAARRELEMPAGLGSRDSAVVEQLLSSLAGQLGPSPAGPVGVGASWSVTFVGDDGEVRRMTSLVAFDGDQYGVVVESDAESGWFSGHVGEALAREFHIEAADGMVTIEGRASAG